MRSILLLRDTVLGTEAMYLAGIEGKLTPKPPLILGDSSLTSVERKAPNKPKLLNDEMIGKAAEGKTLNSSVQKEARKQRWGRNV
jgi:hypothetical protein